MLNKAVMRLNMLYEFQKINLSYRLSKPLHNENVNLVGIEKSNFIKSTEHFSFKFPHLLLNDLT